jgi:Alkylmercury lyase
MPEKVTGSRSASVREQDGLIHVCRSAWLTPAAYHFYRAILLSFPENGRAPSRGELESLAQQYAVDFEETMRQFEQLDLVQRHPETGEISAACPFSAVPTAHHVRLGERVEDGIQANPGDAGRYAMYPGSDRNPHMDAMCTIDALGIPLLLRRTAWIDTRDAITGATIHVHVSPTAEGPLRWSAVWESSQTVVYARPEEHEHEHDCGVAASGTCCQVTQFFVSTEHAADWAAGHAATEGRIYT